MLLAKKIFHWFEKTICSKKNIAKLFCYIGVGGRYAGDGTHNTDISTEPQTQLIDLICLGDNSVQIVLHSL